MKIAYVVPALVNKGPVIVVKDLINVMIANGHQCIVYYLDESDCISVNCPVKKIVFRYSINFDEFDVIHSHGIRPDFYVFLHKPSSCRAMCVSTMHNFVFEDLSSQFNKLFSIIAGRLWMRILNKHDKIAVLTKIALEYYERFLPKDKLIVAYNTRMVNIDDKLSLEEKKVFFNFKENDFCLGVNAMLSPIKGIDLVIQAMTLMENAKLWIVGDGKSMSYLQNLADECGVRSKVHFAGYKNNAFRYLEYYDIFLMPSHSEGFGLTLLEAACYKVPTVCSDIPVFRELFTHNEVSFFKLGNVESLACAIKSGIGNKDMASNMNKKYREYYSPEKFYTNYLSIYMK